MGTVVNDVSAHDDLFVYIHELETQIYFANIRWYAPTFHFNTDVDDAFTRFDLFIY